MSLYGSILSKFGLGSEAKASTGATPPPAAPTPPSTPAPIPAPGATLPDVDVVAHLEALARSHAEPLNWQVSIVDLMKLLSLDSSLAARKALAVELGCPADKMSDSAQMNLWLHKALFRQLAQHGGRVPAELMD